MKKLHINIALCMIAILAVSCTTPPVSTPTPTDQLPTATLAASATLVPVWEIIGTVHFDQPFLYGGFLDKSYGLVLGSVGSGHNGAPFYTSDMGTTWQRSENSSQFLFGLDIVDSQTAWSCGDAGFVRKTLDGGKTWQSTTNFGDPEPNQCRFLSFLDESIGWVATPTRLGLTKDGGDTWQEVTLPPEVPTIAAISLKTASDGYLLSSKGSLFITQDGGKTWTSQPLDFAQRAFLGKMPAPVSAVRFLEDGRAMIVLIRSVPESGFQLWSAYSNDNGQTWRLDMLPINSGIENVFLSRDGKTLTVINTGLQRLAVLQFQAP